MTGGRSGAAAMQAMNTSYVVVRHQAAAAAGQGTAVCKFGMPAVVCPSHVHATAVPCAAAAAAALPLCARACCCRCLPTYSIDVGIDASSASPALNSYQPTASCSSVTAPAGLPTRTSPPCFSQPFLMSHQPRPNTTMPTPLASHF